MYGLSTLPKTKIAPKNGGFQCRNLLFQGSIFRGYVRGREGIPTVLFDGKWNHIFLRGNVDIPLHSAHLVMAMFPGDFFGYSRKGGSGDPSL